MTYAGSLDIARTLEDGGGDYDAVWPASSIWISMGDTGHIVKDTASTSTTPVIFGVKRDKAEALGWLDSSDSGVDNTIEVSTADIMDAVSTGDLKFSMTSATQSNSGASAYLAFLTALNGSDEALTADDLKNPELTKNMKTLLSGVDRSSGSSGWLKDMIVSEPDRYDAMVNYESMVITANKELADKDEDPLIAVYPSDGIAISDSPLGYVDRGQNLEDAFKAFSGAMQTEAVKIMLERDGRRTGLGGVLSYPQDEKVQQAFRSEWGVSADETLKTITLPAADVITTALTLYQTELRKPSWTVWVVDYSGSMEDDGKDGVVKGLREALGQTESTVNLLQPTSSDVNVFIPFSGQVGSVERTTGVDTDPILQASTSTDADGGTDMYAGLLAALDDLPTGDDADKYTVAIVLMTDGESDDSNADRFKSEYESRGGGTPIFPIMFGNANPNQLETIASMSGAKVFDGRSGDLADVFRQVKGYN